MPPSITYSPLSLSFFPRLMQSPQSSVPSLFLSASQSTTPPTRKGEGLPETSSCDWQPSRTISNRSHPLSILSVAGKSDGGGGLHTHACTQHPSLTTTANRPHQLHSAVNFGTSPSCMNTNNVARGPMP